MEKLREIKEKRHWEKVTNNNSMGAVYGLGLLGSAYYYLQHAHTFSEGFMGILKAVVWPAMLVFRLHEFLRM